MCRVHPLDWCQSFSAAASVGELEDSGGVLGGGGALEPKRPTDNASRQARRNLSPPSGPGVARNKALPLGPVLRSQGAFKEIWSARKQLFKRTVVTLERN